MYEENRVRFASPDALFLASSQGAAMTLECEKSKRELCKFAVHRLCVSGHCDFLRGHVLYGVSRVKRPHDCALLCPQHQVSDADALKELVLMPAFELN